MNIPPPKRAPIPPPRKPLPPPAQNLPKGEFVKVVPDPNREGTYKIVTAYMGLIVGPRLDKCKAAIYPDRSSCLTLDEAKEAFAKWECFCLQNSKKQ